MSSTARYLLRRTGWSVLFVAVAATVVFGVVHFGVADPAETTAATPEGQSALAEKKVEFGLDRPITTQYLDYMGSMFRFQFGEAWASQDEAIADSQRRTSVNAIVEQRAGRTAWLWLWTVVFAIPLTAAGIGLARLGEGGRAVGVLSRATPAFLLAVVFETAFFNLRGLFLGLDWRTFLVPTPSTITRPFPTSELEAGNNLALATKLAIPPALALAIPLAGIVAYLWHRGLADSATRSFVGAARAKGLRGALVGLKHVLPVGTVPLLVVAGELAAVLVGMTMLVEVIFSLEGLGSLVYISVVRNDYTSLQAALFVLVVFVAAVDLLGAVGHSLLGIGPERRRQGVWTGALGRGGDGRLPTSSGDGGQPTTGSRRRAAATTIDDGHPSTNTDGGRPPTNTDGGRPPTNTDGGRPPANTDGGLQPRRRVDGVLLGLRETPRPALLWAAGGGLLLALQFGAVLETVSAFVPGVGGLGGVPTLLGRGLVSNAGYRLPGGGWAGTFLGLSPALAWLLRVGLVYAYAAAVGAWAVLGYRLYRDVYRPGAWRPLDDVLAGLRTHRTARVGGAVVAVLLVAAVFAPTLGPVTGDRTLMHSSLDATGAAHDGSGTVRFLEDGSVASIPAEAADSRTRSTSLASVAPGQYDEFGQFHPFGTTYYGTDLFTEMLFGLRIYLFVGGVTVLLAGALTLLAGALALQFGDRVTGAVDRLAGVLGLFPTLPFVFLAAAWFHPVLTTLSTQFTVLAVLFGAVAWPRLWRTVRPLVDEVREREWVEAGGTFDRARSRTVVQALRPLLGVVAAYALVAAAAAIAGTAAVSYLGHLSLGSPHGTFEWGGLLWRGRNFMLTSAGHTFVFPAAGLACLLGAIHALASGLRDVATGQRSASSAGEVDGLWS